MIGNQHLSTCPSKELPHPRNPMIAGMLKILSQPTSRRSATRERVWWLTEVDENDGVKSPGPDNPDQDDGVESPNPDNPNEDDGVKSPGPKR